MSTLDDSSGWNETPGGAERLLTVADASRRSVAHLSSQYPASGACGRRTGRSVPTSPPLRREPGRGREGGRHSSCLVVAAVTASLR